MAGKRTRTQRSTTPVAAPPTPQRRMFAREVPALDLSSISLCVINDNEFLRSYMERLFGIMRVGRVVTFESPAIAREKMPEANPDIVMVDLDLAGQDGLDLVRGIRKGEIGIRNDVAILACSAFVDRDYVLKARNNGINWTLVKPLSFRRLYEGLARVILDERPFVDCEAYTGPDRRLLVGISGYDGFERRKPRQPETGA